MAKMQTPPSIKTYLALMKSMALVVVLAGGTYLSTGKLSLVRENSPLPDDPLYLPNGNYLQLISLDFDGVLSDLFWIKGALYFGSHYRKKDHDYKWLAHFLDLSTEFDPYYYDVYWYGSSILPSVEESIRLLEKGRTYFSTDWKMTEMIGFYYHFYLKDYLAAGRYYEMASLLPGHPPYVPSLAGRFYTEAGDIDSGIRVLKNFYDTCSKKDLKEDFAKRITQLEDIKCLEEKLSVFRKKYQRTPRDLGELVERGLISSLPKEPYGGKYLWDSSQQRVVSTTFPRYGST
jgi:hypothetical protein